jgi:hypothetical protein
MEKKNRERFGNDGRTGGLVKRQEPAHRERTMWICSEGLEKGEHGLFLGPCLVAWVGEEGMYSTAMDVPAAGYHSLE